MQIVELTIMNYIVFTTSLIILKTSIIGSLSQELSLFVDEETPEFEEPIPNITVAVGRDAKLPCIIKGIGSYRAAWLRLEDKTILTIHHHIITRNYRVSLLTSHSDNRNYILHIKNIQESDRGGYMCQINTVPMKSQSGYLDVVVPPDIVVEQTSGDVFATEGSNVTLTCRARGYPTPVIQWRREDGEKIGNWQGKQSRDKIEDVTYEGEKLTINKVSRLHMGAFLCIAANGVPPSVSRRIMLQVHFPPMIWIPNQLIGAPLGGEVTLDCNTEAFPMSINYWTKEDSDMIISNEKYEIANSEKTYKVQMKLKIKNIEAEDFGTYRCFAKNSLGSTEGSIRLYEIHVPGGRKNAREPSTAKIQSLNGSKLPLSDDSDSSKEPEDEYDDGNGERHGDNALSRAHCDIKNAFTDTWQRLLSSLLLIVCAIIVNSGYT